MSFILRQIRTNERKRTSWKWLHLLAEAAKLTEPKIAKGKTQAKLGSNNSMMLTDYKTFREKISTHVSKEKQKTIQSQSTYKLHYPVNSFRKINLPDKQKDPDSDEGCKITKVTSKVSHSFNQAVLNGIANYSLTTKSPKVT
ncbi:unnamed protein product [Hermetia illucens]|uniref:Uncharacterized protein n=1 Tax=Hermetia illucens TaxID=343691 RepID=A0A7R8UXP1_HERIL|nr:unnamed protein product [Hermetia illucens]